MRKLALKSGTVIVYEGEDYQISNMISPGFYCCRKVNSTDMANLEQRFFEIKKQ